MADLVLLDGRRIAYDVSGDGPGLVLVHGITEDHRVWEPLLGRLAAAWTVVAVDVRGHGRSSPASTYGLAEMAGDVHQVVEHLGLSEPVLVGHSMGGTIVTAYAATHSCRAVVNLDQSLDLVGFQTLVRELEPALRSDAFEATIDAVFDQLVGPLDPSEADRIRSLSEPRQDVVLGIWAPLLDLSADELDAMVTATAAGVPVPYLALHGIDPGPDYETWLRERIPTATLEVWPEHGHYPHLVAPDRFLARLEAFTS